jgi:hypothetical protein
MSSSQRLMPCLRASTHDLSVQLSALRSPILGHPDAPTIPYSARPKDSTKLPTKFGKPHPDTPILRYTETPKLPVAVSPILRLAVSLAQSAHCLLVVSPVEPLPTDPSIPQSLNRAIMLQPVLRSQERCEGVVGSPIHTSPLSNNSTCSPLAGNPNSFFMRRALRAACPAWQLLKNT